MDQKEAAQLLAFMSLKKTLTGDGYIGAALVTDLQGVPQEFRCTHPVKPTAVQKALYGAALEPYIAVELCGRPLFGMLKNKPSLLIVEDEALVEVRGEIRCPVVVLQKAGAAIEVRSTGGEGPSQGRIESKSGKFQPLVVTTHRDYADDFSAARSIVEEAHFDLIEPFDRIVKALEMLSKQDERFR